MSKFLVRGVVKYKDSKIKRFAYGHYFKVGEKHYIILDDVEMSKNGYNLDCITESHFIEIIQEPDKFLGFKDKNDKMVFERDKLRIGYFAFNDDKFEDEKKGLRSWENLPDGINELDITTEIENWEAYIPTFNEDNNLTIERWIKEINFLFHNPDVVGFEIIGNKHNI